MSTINLLEISVPSDSPSAISTTLNKSGLARSSTLFESNVVLIKVPLVAKPFGPVVGGEFRVLDLTVP